MDFASDLLEEIAFEGLDGITVQGLWLRLSQRPDFICASHVMNDEKTKVFLWKIVIRLRDVEFFVLPNAREPLTIISCYTVDDELGVITEATPIGEDIYPHKLINDNGILGSCSTYNERKNVTDSVRKLSLPEAEDQFGDKLVIVASQQVRYRSLVGVNKNPNVDVSPIQFCILERIGRSRYSGVTSQGKLGLSAVGEDPKSIFYLRKHLLKHNLIRKQYYQQKSGISNFAGLLLHLPRFYKFLKPKYVELLECMITIIKESPNDFIDFMVLRRKMSFCKKLSKILCFKKYFGMENRPYREVYPDSSEKQWKSRGDKDRVVRVVFLRDPNMKPGDIHKKVLDNIDEDDDDEEEKSEFGLLDVNNRLLDVSMMNQCCMILKNHVGEGLSQMEVAKYLGLQKLQARSLLRNLVKMNVVGTYMVDSGRQRSSKYYYKCGSKLNESHRLLLETSTLSDLGQTMNSESQSESVSLNVEDIAIQPEMMQCDTVPRSFKIVKRNISPNADTNDSNKRIRLDVKEEESVNNEQHADTSGDSEMMDVDDKDETNEKNHVSMEDDNVVKHDLDKQTTVTIIRDYNWLIQNINVSTDKLKDNSMNTLRLLKRSNLIVEAVHELKVTDTRKLALLINKHEYKEGFSHTMDKRSLFRILYKLASSNYIKVFRVVLQNANNTMEFNFVCDMNVTQDDPRIKSAIQFNKMKFHSGDRSKESVRQSLTLRKQVANSTFQKNLQNFHIPKFNRMSLLHKFLYYLIYEYTGSETLDQESAKLKIIKECERELDSLPTIYLSTIDERMFVPPLPSYDVRNQKGWCLLSDVLIRLPLSLFLSLVQIQFYIPELDDYMNHPIKKYYLINSLPLNIRKCITATRKYVFSVFDDLVKLAQIGLVQFGAQQNKDKDQVYIFLNMNTVLMDTTTSKPSYNTISPNLDYPLFNYHFDNLQVVHEYWYNCWKICMNTNLGMRSKMSETCNIENVHDKQDMVDAIKSREFVEAVEKDKGLVPGDKLGAAGFDSALFSHLKRNWFSKVMFSSTCVNKFLPTATVQSKKPSPSVLSQVQNTLVTNKETKGKGVKKNKPRITKPKVIRRSNVVSKILRRKPYYDPVDREALKLMSKLRVDWSAEEDRALLICKVASSFLCSNTRRHINQNLFRSYREVLHKLYPQSLNKTSRACHRRVMYMLRSADTHYNVQLCVEELKMDEYFMGKYSNVFKMIHEEARKQKKKLSDWGDIWHDSFKNLVNELLHRYDNEFHHFSLDNFNNKIKCKLNIPDTLKDFYECFNVQLVEKQYSKHKSVYQPIANKNDIYAAVINSTIHSTLSCDTDNTSWSYHLFSIYQQYPEKVLRSVLNWMRANHIVSYRKSYQVKKDKTLYMPVSASPYQLSITYVNLMQTKYQSSTFIECYKTLYDILEASEDYMNKECKIVDDNEVCEGVELSTATGGQTAATVELYNKGIIKFSLSIPNQIIMLDPNIKDKDETYSRLVQRYEDLLKVNNKDLTCSILFQNCSTTADSNEINNGLNEEDDDESGDEGNDKECSNKQVIQNVAKASSRIALFMINEDFDHHEGLIPKEIDHIYDFFLVNSCKVFGKLLGDVNVDICALQVNTINCIVNDLCNFAIYESDNIGKLVKDSNDKEMVNHDNREKKEGDCIQLDKIINDHFNDEDVDLAKSILEKVKDKNELGMTNKELIEEFGNTMKIVNIMDTLIRLSLVLKSGLFYCRYIHYLFARPWLLCSFRTCEESDDETIMKENKNIVISNSNNDNMPKSMEVVGEMNDKSHSITNDNEEDIENDKVCKSIKVVDEINDNSTIRNDDKEDIDKVCESIMVVDEMNENKIGNNKEDIGNNNNVCKSVKVVDEMNQNKSDTNRNDNEEVISNDNIVENIEIVVQDNDELNKSTEENKFEPKSDSITIKNHRMSEPIKVNMRPWINVNGTLNRGLIDNLLGSVLGHIMLYPGVSLVGVQKRFAPAYLPQHIQEVCDILIKLKCITRYCVFVKNERSLFSKPCEVIIENGTGLEAGDAIRYESTVLAITNLGKFVDSNPNNNFYLQSST